MSDDSSNFNYSNTIVPNVMPALVKGELDAALALVSRDTAVTAREIEGSSLAILMLRSA